MKTITIKLTEAEVEAVIHDLCVDLEACGALNAGDAYREYEAHKEANSILDKLIAAGATKENFQGWGRRWEEGRGNA